MASIDSSRITIVGLGPGPLTGRTLTAQQSLQTANRIFFRSHDGVDASDLGYLPATVVDLEELRRPDDAEGGRWGEAVSAVLAAATREPVVVAIPGHPCVGEGLVGLLISRAAEQGLGTAVVDGISALDVIATALGVDLVQSGAQVANGRVVAHLAEEHPFEGGLLALSPLRPMLFTHVYDAGVCRSIHHLLTPLLPDDYPVRVVDRAGLAAEEIREIRLSELPREPGGPLVALWIPASDEFGAAVSDPRAMQRITARLRRPDGCPWDRKQTHESLARNFVDEVYEVVDAIESGDPAAVAEELGDLFLLIMMQAQIGHEAGTFSIEDVYAGIARKIVGRHTHVFGAAVVESDADLSGVWAAAKEREQAEGRKHGGKDVDGEPFSMPALTRASRILAKHPVVVGDNAPEFLRIVGEIVARGEDPDAILKQQLRDHVSQTTT